jgi:hypothetical protein
MYSKEKLEYNRIYYRKRYEDGICYQCKNPRDSVRRLCAKCRAKNQAKYKAKAKRAKSLDKCIQCFKPAAKGHRRCTRCLERRNEQGAEYRLRALQAYGMQCACCGEKMLRFLTIDHVNNDGNKHRKEIYHSQMTRWLYKHNYPPGFQTLCFNCNMGKAMNGGVCPHKTDGPGMSTYSQNAL